MSIFTKGYGQDMPDPKMIAYRPPTAEGSFYPSDADSLRSLVNRFVDTASPSRIKDDIIAMVVPHAGYVYSGKVAGKAYRELRNRKYDAVIIVAPSHFQRFSGSSVFNGEAYTTPFGNVLVDVELARAIAGIYPSVKLSREGHGWSDSLNEHSLEVQLPFLQVVQPGTPIVPIVMGTQDFQSADVLMKAIVRSVRSLKRKVLLIASSDMSHYHDKATARTMDLSAGRTFARFDYFQLGSKLFSHDWEACGPGPIVTVMMAAEQLGANKSTPVSYMTSAESEFGNHDTTKVVGYFSGIMTSNGTENTLDLPVLSDEDKSELISTARNAIEKTILDKDSADSFYVIPRSLSEKYASFVTLKKHGQLRACMGHIYPNNQLFMEVRESARLAATNDYRFGALDSGELKDIEIDITILSRFKRILDTNLIQPGTDGLYLRLGEKSGLLLPQVAAERNWDRTTFLENLSMKAGLPAEAYMNPQAEIFIFRAEAVVEPTNR